MAILGFVILQEFKLSVDFGFKNRWLFAILPYSFSFKPMLNSLQKLRKQTLAVHSRKQGLSIKSCLGLS
jgi:hypothetical protein